MKLVKSVLSASILAAVAQSAVAVEIDPYASIRANYIAGDADGQWNDAYTRAGVNVTEELDNITISYNLEFDYDPTQENHNDMSTSSIRTNVIKLSGDFGTLAYGRDWAPYYNAVSYGVGPDRFYGTYSGFTVDAVGKPNKTLFYTAPKMGNLQISAAYTRDNAADYGWGTGSGGTNGKDKQIAATYDVNDSLMLAAGMVRGDDAQEDRNGFGASYTTGAWLLTANYQERKSATEITGTNVFARYQMDEKNSLRAHYAHIETEGSEDINPITLGFMHQYNDDLKVFVEYYDDDSGANQEYPQIGFHYNL